MSIGVNKYDTKEINDLFGYVRDVEIAYLLKQIANKGAIVNAVLDSCYSGRPVMATALEDPTTSYSVERYIEGEFCNERVGPGLCSAKIVS